MNITNAVNELFKIASTNTSNVKCGVIVTTGRHKKNVEDILDILLEYHKYVNDIPISIKRDIKANTIRNIFFDNGCIFFIKINDSKVDNADYVVLDNELNNLREIINYYQKMIVTDVSNSDVEWCKNNFNVKKIAEEILNKIENSR